MSLSANLFEEDYRQKPDAFNFEDNPFELTKYYAQLALLTDTYYDSGLELGCSIGMFTALLAPKCDRLLALDFAPSAVAQARARCAELPNVRVDVATLPAEFPNGIFDLITFSEFGYYLDAADLARLRERITRATEPGAHLVVTHMTTPLEPYMNHALPSTYEQVHGPFHTDPHWELVTRLAGYDRDVSGGEHYWCELFERLETD